MRLKRTLVSAIAALALMASVMVPAALAGTTGDTSDATVTTNDVGVFDVSVGDLTFGSVDVSASTGATKYTVLSITYTDTKTYRNGFTTEVKVGDLNSNVQVPYIGGTYKIPATNLQITRTYNPQQGFCSSDFPECPASPSGYRVGDISGYGPTGKSTEATWGDWTSATGSLDQARTVNEAWAGSGTDTTTQALDVKLTVPAGMPATQYSSLVTLEIIPTTP